MFVRRRLASNAGHRCAASANGPGSSGCPEGRRPAPLGLSGEDSALQINNGDLNRSVVVAKNVGVRRLSPTYGLFVSGAASSVVLLSSSGGSSDSR